MRKQQLCDNEKSDTKLNRKDDEKRHKSNHRKHSHRNRSRERSASPKSYKKKHDSRCKDGKYNSRDQRHEQNHTRSKHDSRHRDERINREIKSNKYIQSSSSRERKEKSRNDKRTDDIDVADRNEERTMNKNSSHLRNKDTQKSRDVKIDNKSADTRSSNISNISTKTDSPIELQSAKIDNTLRSQSIIISQNVTVNNGSALIKNLPIVNPSALIGTTTKKIDLPSYYNPNAINVNKYADQAQKRKLLWSGKKEESGNCSKWNNAFNSDDKVASKFMRLMGIKQQSNAQDVNTTATVESKPKDILSNMEQQYEVARYATHISRGVGLGFGSQRP